MVYMPKEFGDAIIQVDKFISENPDADYTILNEFLRSLPFDYDFIKPLFKLLDENRGNSLKYKATIRALIVELDKEEPLDLKRCIWAAQLGYERYLKEFPDQPTVDEKLADNGCVDEEQIHPAMKRYHTVHQPV